MSSDDDRLHERAMARSRSFPQAVRADATAFVAPGAVVVGEVILGARSSVWFGAVLRGDMDSITLGEESNIQDNSVVHVDADVPVSIGRRVVVGHRAIVHGATVEDGCLIGMGSILLNRSRIGAGSLVAAGALVSEDKQIPPGSLVVGVPGKVVGPVTPEMRAGIERGAAHYVALSRTYLARGIGSALPPASGTVVVQAGLLAPDDLEIERLLGVLALFPFHLGRLRPVLAFPAEGSEAGRILGAWLEEEEALG